MKSPIKEWPAQVWSLALLALIHAPLVESAMGGRCEGFPPPSCDTPPRSRNPDPFDRSGSRSMGPQLSLTTQTEEMSPRNRSRERIGVGEVVILSLTGERANAARWTVRGQGTTLRSLDRDWGSP